MIKSRECHPTVVFSGTTFKSLTVESHIYICKIVKKFQEIWNYLQNKRKTASTKLAHLNHSMSKPQQRSGTTGAQEPFKPVLTMICRPK